MPQTFDKRLIAALLVNVILISWFFPLYQGLNQILLLHYWTVSGVEAGGLAYLIPAGAIAFAVAYWVRQEQLAAIAVAVVVAVALYYAVAALTNDAWTT